MDRRETLCETISVVQSMYDNWISSTVMPITQRAIVNFTKIIEKLAS